MAQWPFYMKGKLAREPCSILEILDQARNKLICEVSLLEISLLICEF